MLRRHDITVLLLLFSSGVYVFTQGYLLTRIVLPNISSKCANYALPPRFNKTLLVLVDALRFDFINYDKDLALKDTPHYRNKLPVIDNLLQTKPYNALLYKALADPPSTTLQRLIALMTGTVCFIIYDF